ncbi:MAG: DUF1987 domain-containing protein [Bacteroidales bacterium]|nr:DUF1987 domain-containing protein [Bacteroidales bacterium]
MEVIKIESTPKTPAVNFDPNEGIIEIRGRSIPENSIEFYRPLIEWIEKYAENPKPETIVNVQFEYFNTSSSKCILDIFKRIENIHNAGHKVIVNWYYEEDDEDMLEAGEDYQSIIKVPFKMIEVPA